MIPEPAGAHAPELNSYIEQSTMQVDPTRPQDISTSSSTLRKNYSPKRKKQVASHSKDLVGQSAVSQQNESAGQSASRSPDRKLL